MPPYQNSPQLSLRLKYMSLKWLLLPTRQLLVGYETRNKYKAVSNSIIEAVATFLVIFGAHMSILFIIKVKMILVLVK